MSILHSRIVGEGEPLVILHGFLGMSDNWKTLGNQFADEGFQVHLVDQRNHGRSFHAEAFNYELLTQDLLSYIDHYNIESADVIGHSMGGKTAMLFATSHPERMHKLVVADIAPKYYPTHHHDILAGLQSIDFDLVKSRKEADDQLSKYVSEFGVRQFLLKNLYWEEKGRLGFRMNLPALVDNVEEIGEALPIGARFEGSTLFLRGDRSEYIAPAETTLIKMHFPNSALETIENAGHWLHAENPSAFKKMVLAFLKR